MQFGRFNYVLLRCKSKSVLHIGCVDEGLTKDRLASGLLLHSRIADVAASLRGIDISRVGLLLLNEAGFRNLLCLDIEKETPQGHYDVVVIPEVLEHLSNPGAALDNIRKIDSKEFIFSVPAALLRHPSREHPDHNFYFTKKSISALLGKHGFKIEHIEEYSWARLRLWADGYLITAR